jgi:NADH-quinone oxidoreductase subunit H
MNATQELTPLIPFIIQIHHWLGQNVPVIGKYLAMVPSSVVALISLPLLALILISVAAGIGGIMTYLERRVAARIQFRIGPNRVGFLPQGLLQFLADGVKLLQKEDLIPDEADKPLFRLAPYLVCVGTFLAFVVLPINSVVIFSDINIGIFYILAVTSFVVIGIIMAGWASNSKWALLGALRSAAQIIAYEIPTGMAVLNVVLLAGTLSMQGIIKGQGGLPWEWNMFHNPFIFISVFIYFTAALAENNRTPFDIPEAESELVSGYNTEYSGMRFGLFFMAEFANVFLISAICTTLFLGGWQLWFPIENFFFKTVLETGVFLLKSGALVFLILQLRWTLPRLRVDQLMSTCWKYLVPVAFVNIIGTAFWMVYFPHGTPIISGLLVLFMASVMVFYVYNIWQDLKTVSGALRFNPMS